MTQEEKAKAYDKAIERAKAWRNKSGIPSDRKGVLDDIFPELIESEDEKIRKDIITFLRSKNGYMTPDEDWYFHNKWLPWLEKQGEQKRGCIYNKEQSDSAEEEEKRVARLPETEKVNLVKSTPLADVGLKTHTKNSLCNYFNLTHSELDEKTLGYLAKLKMREFRKCRNVGKGTCDDVRNVLGIYGLTLEEEQL